MRELTFEEMNQVAGGGGIWDKVVDVAIKWVTTKGLDYAYNNAGAYVDYLVECWAKYGAGPYDYRQIS